MRILSVVLLCCFLTHIPLSADSGICDNTRICVVVPCEPVRKAIVQKLKAEGYRYIVEESCNDSKQIGQLFESVQPECVIVDGTDDTDPSRTLLIDTQTLYEAERQGVKRCILLSSFAIYPTSLKPPFKEDLLLKQQIEKQKDPYTIAKLTALQQCHTYNDPENPRFITCVYPYLYGSKALETTVQNPVTQIFQRISQAMQENRQFALISNTGKGQYELFHINDLTSAIVFLVQSSRCEYEIVNVGIGHDMSTLKIANSIYKGSGYKGELIFDATEFDEVPRRILDTSRIQSMGWSPAINTMAALKNPDTNS